MKKNNVILLTVIAAWLLIPTGTPDDIITFTIIGVLGKELYYILIVGVAASWLHYNLTINKAKKTIGSFVRRISKFK